MKEKNSLIIILGLAICVSFANIGGLDIYALDEAKNAEAARAMFVSGDYVVPMYNGKLRTDKPSLHYYFMAAGYQLFGVNPFGARFFSSIMSVLTILMTFLFVKKNFNVRTAVYSALVLICSLHFNLQFHMSVPDPYLIFFLTWAFFSFHEAYKTNKKHFLLQFYFAIGCGLLTKGPIALALPGISAVMFLIINKDFNLKTIWRLQPFGGIMLSLGVAFPWYYTVHQQTNGAWTEDFFFKHNVSRFSGAFEGHEGIFILTIVYALFLGMLTVLPFVFQSLKNAWKNKQESTLLMCLCGVITIVGFFSISSTKLPNYTTPSYPLIAVLVGVYLSKVDESWFKNVFNKIGLWAYAILLLIFPIGIYFGLAADPVFVPVNYTSFYFIILSILGAVLIFSILKKNISTIVNSLLGGWLVMTLVFFFLAYPNIDAQNPVRKTIPKLNSEVSFVSYKRLNPAFVFELQREIPLYNELSQIQMAMLESEEGYVISRTSYKQELLDVPGLSVFGEEKDIFENPTTLILYWNRKP